MPFFSRQITVNSGTTKEVLSIPSGVKINCLAVRADGSTWYISAHGQAYTTGMKMYSGNSLIFSAGDFDGIIDEEKRLFVYAADDDVIVQIIGVIDVTNLLGVVK